MGQIIEDLVHCVIREIENGTKIRIIQEERSQWKYLGKKLKEKILSCNETEGEGDLCLVDGIFEFLNRVSI